MRIFISWSGARSQAVASALARWLPDVFQDVDPWMSAHHIDAGSRWGSELDSSLAETNFGILCLTKENLSAPWLLYEAGAIAKLVTSSRVVPYRLGLGSADVHYPLAQFQSVDASESGTRKMLDSINRFRSKVFTDDRVSKLFEKHWPELEQAIMSIPPVTVAATPAELERTTRTDRDILEEVLAHVRSISSRDQPEPTGTTSNLGDWIARFGVSAPATLVTHTLASQLSSIFQRLGTEDLIKFHSDLTAHRALPVWFQQKFEFNSNPILSNTDIKYISTLVLQEAMHRDLPDSVKVELGIVPKESATKRRLTRRKNASSRTNLPSNSADPF